MEKTFEILLKGDLGRSFMRWEFLPIFLNEINLSIVFVVFSTLTLPLLPLQ